MSYGVEADEQIMAKEFFPFTPWNRWKLVKAFLAFINRPYFTRVWILQELYMGSKVSFCCGPDLLPAKRVLALSQLVNVEIDYLQHGEASGGTFSFLISQALAKLRGNPDKTWIQQVYKDIKPQRGCLTLAVKEETMFSAKTIVEVIASFQCADPRDKVYGILSLVYWPDYFVPVPDYNRDVFELASEVLAVTYEGEMDKRTLASWVGRLAEVFELSPTHKTVQDAIKTRNHLAADSAHFQHSCYGFPLLADTGWEATKIQPFAFRRDVYADLYCSAAKSGDTVVTLFDRNSVPFAQAPLGTRAGDWYMESSARPKDGSKDGDMIGLIIRDTGLERYTIVGSAGKLSSQRNWHTERTIPPDLFEIFWNIQDALLFHLVTRNIDDVERTHIARICRSEGSSFARKATQSLVPLVPSESGGSSTELSSLRASELSFVADSDTGWNDDY
jgi:hypothetical protein